MSKKTKALKRRGNGTKQEVHTHNRTRGLYPHQLEIIEKGIPAGEVMVFAGSAGKSK